MQVTPPHRNFALNRANKGSELSCFPTPIHPVVIMAMHTGLWQGELLRLTWADIDWNVGVLTVQEPKAHERQSDSNEFDRGRTVFRG